MSAVTTPPTLPYSEQIERDTVGILMMQGTEQIERASETLTDAHFHHVGYLAIFKHVMALWRAGKPINDVHVIEAMRGNGTLERSGGPSLVFDVSTNGERYYAEAAKHSLAEFLPKLEAYRQARVGVEAALRLQAAAQACDIEAMQASAEEVLRATTTSEKKRRGERWKDIGARWVNRDMTKLKGISTGFRWLDENLGGLRRGNLVIIAGGTSDGKTSLAINIAVNVALLGEHVDIYSQEMSNEENWERGFAYEKEIRSTALATGILNREEYKRLTEYTIEDKPIRVYDDCGSIAEIEAEVRLSVMRDQTRLVVVDYLQLVEGQRDDTREREIAQIGERLKKLAQRYQITVIAMSQLNDDGKVRESRAIKQHANQMLTILVREDDDTARCIKIEKNRGGKRYIKCAYRFEGEHFAFRELGEITAKDKDEFPEASKPRGKNGFKPRTSGQFPSS